MLDDKRPEVRAQTANAPYIVDYLCGDCKAHHDTVRALLTSLDIPFEDAPRLVRGLDYYMRTTYEFDHALLGAQSGIGGGGRYDGLSEDIGGPSLPGIGFAVGLDRIVLAIEAERGDQDAHAATGCQVFGVPLGDDAHTDVLALVTALRRAGVTRRHGVRQPGPQGRDEGGRPVRCPLRGDHRRGRARMPGSFR